MKKTTFVLTRGFTGHRNQTIPSSFLALLAILAIFTGFGARAADVLDGKIITLDIAANTSLEDALIEWGTKAGMTVLINTQEIDHRVTHGARGTLSARAALAVLLRESGLSYTQEGNRIRIVPESASLKATKQGEVTGVGTASDIRRDGESASGGADAVEHNADGHGTTTAGGSRGRQLDEVIVTAQKREERLIDVPMSATVLSADTLSQSGDFQFRDWAQSVPGLSFTTTGAGYTQISIRGITSFTPTGTVGIYVDDVPYGSSSSFAEGGNLALDVGLFDLDRIEVLRGPQGTLYGASTMGGLVKYVTKRPNENTFSVEVQSGVATTQDGGLSYNTATAINAPIIPDKLGLRVSGFYSHDGGYIDNVALAENDVNRSNIYGGRADLLFTPIDALSVRLTGFLQDIYRNGEGTVDYANPSGVPEEGPLDQSRLLPLPFHQQFHLASGTVIYELGPATITSISAYQSTDTHHYFDVSGTFVPALQDFVGTTYGSVGTAPIASTDKFTQEIRIASSGKTRLEWLVGGFYNHESSALQSGFILRYPSGQIAPNNIFSYTAPSRYREYAAFADVTYHFTQAFDVSVGIRDAWDSQTYSQTVMGILGTSEPPTTSSESTRTYLADARYHFNELTTGYLRYATGFRPGGPNFLATDPKTGLPVALPSFQSDSLKSYEIGFKAEGAGGKLGVDLAAYYIDWSNIQIGVLLDNVSAITNASGGAAVRGMEATLTGRPTRDLTVAASYAYQNPYLKEADTALGGAAGERLPYVPRSSLTLNADCVLAAVPLRPLIGATAHYVSGETAGFAGNPPQYHLPQYATVDLRGGVSVGPVNTQLYAHNILDKRGQLSASVFSSTTEAVSIAQPRTFGVTATVKF